MLSPVVCRVSSKAATLMYSRKPLFNFLHWHRPFQIVDSLNHYIAVSICTFQGASWNLPLPQVYFIQPVMTKWIIGYSAWLIRYYACMPCSNSRQGLCWPMFGCAYIAVAIRVCFHTLRVVVLTHWGRDKMVAIFQTTFSWMKMHEFWLRLHWNLFLRVQLTIFQHWFR